MIADIFTILLFIILALLGSPYQSFNYSNPEWLVIGSLWHSFEWILFRIAPLVIIVITSILVIQFINREK